MTHFDRSVPELRCPRCGMRSLRLTCPQCGWRWGDQPSRGTNWRLVVELLPLLGLTLISVYVAISVHFIRQMNSVTIGNVTTEIGELRQYVGQVSQTINGNVSTQVQQLKQEVSNVVVSSGSRATGPAPINLQFACYDAATQAVLAECSLHIRVVEETPVADYVVTSSSSLPIAVQLHRQLEVTASKAGYKTKVDVFDYVEDGQAKSHEIRLESE